MLIFYKDPIILVKKSYNYFYLKIKKNSILAKYIDQRSDKYFYLIKKISEKYNIDISLVLAIIKIESNFNPYAISNSEALGLMQIMQTTAGRDVFRMQGKLGYPSKSYLLNPKNNVNIGIAYLSLLQNTYLNNIVNPLARLYILIIAYNGGLNGVFHIFSEDKNKTMLMINKMKPSQIYSILINDHPSLVSRKYLYQVVRMQKIYKERFQKAKKYLNL
ncbi:transglycosylase SLT domain-containing protein [Candidatus Tachikawaea gelatinosa]|uniref:peptidoglycan lytic exotransglycosylase n=1 Tax=Candidatus Tachikawaea gelatinosa TaxID=1410383 RepID=A0A090AJN2_9ENTR|nr:transglycosylase SLT domain-containing protein [Candidatus Tachikawaea gelatinosa]BAP58658.1 lytic transglycosylase catalytic [Candidatus Tachikawaea gelatinosa]